MSFLAPLWLLLGAAAAVPLLLHLMRRRIGNRVDFPAVRYLERAEREHSARLRLRNLLLMLLRVAAVLLIALAAARPVSTLAAAGGHAPTALALVVDNSLSSGAVSAGVPVLERLRTEADAILAAATADDRLWLVTADGAVQAGSPAALRDALARLAPIGGAGSIPDALARADALVAAADLPTRQVVLLTDGQASAWPASVALQTRVASVYRAAGDPPANRALVEAAPVPSRWTPRGAVALRLAGADSATYRLTLDERTLSRGTAIGDAATLVRVAPGERGWLAGAARLEPDELRGDDVRHFAVWVGPPVGVAVSPSAGAFAASAVDALAQSGRAVVGGDVAVVAADAATRLPAVLLAPTEPARVGAANRALERLGVPWRFGPARTGRTALRGDRADGAMVDLRYPLRAAGAGAAADTLLTAGGEPWAVAGDGYVLLASPLDLRATTLPLRAGFVPWLGDAVAQRLGAARGALLEAAPGARLTLPAEVDALEWPGGERRAAGGALDVPAEPGVYFLLRGAERVGALVVNPEPQESVLRRLSSADLRARVRARDLLVTSDPATLRARAWSGEGGRSATGPLLAGALLLLVAEAAVARRGGGRRPAGS